jgi:DNA-binding transcriptional LysR family regulator
MKTETLDEFIVLAKHSSFTSAAKELYISQPRLSSHISSLEKELGFRLFDRSGASLHLTHAGSVFLETAQKTLAVLGEGQRQAKDAAFEMPPLAVGSLALDSPYYAALTKVKSPAFIFVDVPEEMTAFKAVEKGLVDIGNHFDYTDMPKLNQSAEAAGLCFAATGHGLLTISVMADHPIAAKKELCREDLFGLKVVITSGTHFDSWRLLVEKTLGEDLGIKFSLNQIRSVQNIAFLDMGDTAHICSNGVINACFAGRGDVVSYDRLDGRPVLYPDGFVYKQSNKRAFELIQALKAQMACTKADDHAA